MSKKQRPKKKYKPKNVAVPPYLNSLDAYSQRTDIDPRDGDRTFLLQVANRTVSEGDLVINCYSIQAAWALAEKMENTSEIRKCLSDGFAAVGAYLDVETREEKFTPEVFEMLSQAIETTRSIFENSGQVERAQALNAALRGQVNIRI